ncbi:hypothetical protein QUB33_27395 [Microcoleus sp. B3-A4]|uniref:hypothetical protein n=1 Tax=Microcoleus sp. B3-A4 TaxID=2818653 RepID=UPI002FD17427
MATPTRRLRQQEEAGQKLLRFYSTKPADPGPIESAQANLVCGASRLPVCGRFATATRERFFEIVNRLKKQIWILYQATYEYQKNHL